MLYDVNISNYSNISGAKRGSVGSDYGQGNLQRKTEPNRSIAAQRCDGRAAIDSSRRPLYEPSGRVLLAQPLRHDEQSVQGNPGWAGSLLGIFAGEDASTGGAGPQATQHIAGTHGAGWAQTRCRAIEQELRINNSFWRRRAVLCPLSHNSHCVW